MMYNLHMKFYLPVTPLRGMKMAGKNISCEHWRSTLKLMTNIKISKKYIWLLLMLFVYNTGFAQKRVESVKTYWDQFNKALIEKDSKTLFILLHRNLSYGHSNAWLESKETLIKNLSNGIISYNKVTTEKIDVITISNELATVRADVLIDADYDGSKGLVFHLHVLQTWKWHHKYGWQLVNRQAVGIKDK